MARKDSTVKDLEELHRQAKSARSRLEGVWYLNLAYYSGNQWVRWDGRNIVTPRLGPSRITFVDNRIQPVVRKELAKMTKNRPIFTVTPNSADEQDTNAAELGEQLMRYFWTHLKMRDLDSKALLWSRICSAAFFKVFWDPSIGEKQQVIVGPDGKVMTDPTDPAGPVLKAGSPQALLAQQAAASMGQSLQVKSVAPGDIRVEVRSPFQMGIDPLADTFSEAEWVVEESVKSTDYIKQRYGVELKADTPANPGMIEARMGMSVQSTGNYMGVKIREYWSKPNSQHPQGYRCVWVPGAGGKGSDKGQVLEQDSQPFDCMPYVMLSGIPVPGRMWPTCIVEQLRPLQTELNKVKSQIAENRNRVGNPTILASRQAIQDPEKFVESTTLPGGVHFFDDIGSPNAVPSYLQAPPLPEYVIDEIQRIEEAFQEISGQHEVASAQVPPGVTAASAINLLMESDDTMLAPGIHDHEEALGALGTKVMKLAARYYTDPRTIKIAGENGAWQIEDFKGEMLNGNTHVQVQAGSSFPQSKAAKQAMIQDLMTFFVQSGNPPHGRQLAQFLQDSEIGAAERLISQYTRDEAQANRENTLMCQGMQLPINPYDDDEAHVANHEDFQKSARFQSYSPQMQQIHLQHTALHRQRMQQVQQQQLEQQMQMMGQVPPAMSQAALQAEHELSQLQGQQDMQVQQDQANQKMSIQGQQAGLQQLQQAMQQRQAEELHQQSLRHNEEKHQAGLRQMSEQAQQRQEANRGRSSQR